LFPDSGQEDNDSQQLQQLQQLKLGQEDGWRSPNSRCSSRPGSRAGSRPASGSFSPPPLRKRWVDVITGITHAEEQGTGSEIRIWKSKFGATSSLDDEK